MKAAWIFVALSLVFAGGEALAQEGGEGLIELDEIQIDMLRKGIAAEKAGDFKEALRLHSAAVALGESNLALLNLGLAHQRLGDCKQAHQTYKRALSAPKVKEPAPEVVTEAIDGFLAELSETCPGSLKVVCTPSDATLQVGGQSAQCGSEISLDPGTHKVVVTFGDESQEHTVRLVGLETKTLEVSMGSPVAKKPDLEADPVKKKPRDPALGDKARMPVDKGASGSTIAGWTFVGLGAVSLAGGAVMGFLVDDVNARGDALSEETFVSSDDVQALKDEAELNNTLQFVGYGLGVASLTTGLVLLVLDGGDEQPQPTSGLSPVVIPGGGGAVWTTPF